MNTTRLGELLIHKGLITRTQLAAALEEQRSTKEFLGALCVRKGWVSEDALVDALAEQFDLPRAQIVPEEVDVNLVRRFSPALLNEHHCLPLRIEDQAVIVAIANPLDAWAVSELERAAGFRKVQLVLASTKEIDVAVARVQEQILKGLG